MSAVAYMLGARVIEKHFTLSHAAKGTDHALLADAGGNAQARARPPAHPDRDRRRSQAAARRARRSRSRRWGRSSSPSAHCRRVTSSPREISSRSRRPTREWPPYELESLLGHPLTRALAEDEAIRAADVAHTPSVAATT